MLEKSFLIPFTSLIFLCRWSQNSHLFTYVHSSVFQSWIFSQKKIKVIRNGSTWTIFVYPVFGMLRQVVLITYYQFISLTILAFIKFIYLSICCCFYTCLIFIYIFCFFFLLKILNLSTSSHSHLCEQVARSYHRHIKIQIRNKIFFCNLWEIGRERERKRERDRAIDCVSE